MVWRIKERRKSVVQRIVQSYSETFNHETFGQVDTGLNIVFGALFVSAGLSFHS